MAYADPPTLPEEDALPGATRAQAIAAFTKDCHAPLKATAYFEGEEEEVAECLARTVEQNCSPDFFGCDGALDTCQVACQPKCTRCQETCAGTCDGCKAACADGDAACVKGCAEERADCRERCIKGLRQCQGGDCEQQGNACFAAGIEKLKACDVEQCDDFLSCYESSDDYEHAEERCLPKMKGLNAFCQDVCIRAHEMPTYLIEHAEEGDGAQPRRAESPGDLAKACTAEAECPADYAAVAPYLASFCAGTTSDASFNTLAAEVAKGRISKRTLGLTFNAYGAIHGYVFKREKWMNGFFYGAGGAWLPEACRRRMKTVASAKVMPFHLTKLRDRFKKLWSKAK
ncbi:MAG: hypothetical protein EP329_20025 [Deltaproteobacteria bacterium]|nr:MAG: hypothetical protein EP329_20025 [Deltaproteobacteria bacterium]